MHKNQLMFIITLVLAIVITIFGVVNSEPVAINLLFYKIVASQALIIFISAALGAIIAAFLGMAKQIRLRGETKALRKENEELLVKVNNLSNELSSAKMKKDEIGINS
ncbi:MAG: LapA family protein [Clostridiaceae bacterium]